MYIFPTALRVFKIEKFRIIDDIPEKPLYRHTNDAHGFVVQLHIFAVLFPHLYKGPGGGQVGG